MQDSRKIIEKLDNVYLFENDIFNAISIYSTFLNNDKKINDYSNSLVYYLQSARNFWAYYLSPEKDSLITITTRYPDGRLPFVITYPIGELSKSLAEDCFYIASKLREYSGEKVFLKKIPQSYVSTFISAGFTEYAKNDGWSIRYKYDDDEFPEFIIDIPRYLQGMNKDAEIPIPYASKTWNIRGHAQRFLRWLKREGCNINISSYNHSKDYKNVMEMINTWAKFRKKRHCEEELNDLVDSHECFLKGIENINNKTSMKVDYKTERFSKSFVMRVIKKNQSKVIAFGFVDKVSNDTVGIYSEIALHQRDKFNKLKWESINDNGVPGCSEVLILFMLQAAYENGYTYANFGGSESEELYKNRKQKFPDYKENIMTHLALY